MEPSDKRPTEAIAELLTEELRRLILGLPQDLQESVPEQLKEDTGLARGEASTRKSDNNKDG
jgi:hypothetical protein